MAKDVNVTIDVLKPSGFTTETFPLIIGAKTGGFAYKVYEGDDALDLIKVDFAETTETYKLARAILQQNNRPEKVAIAGYDETAGTPDVVFEEVKGEAFYYVLTTSADVEEQKALVEAIDLQGAKVAILRVNDIVDLETLEESGVKRAYVLYTDDVTRYIDGEFIGVYAADEAGSSTAKFKQFFDVRPVNVTPTEQARLKLANGSTYIEKFGEAQTTDSKTLGGEHLDVIVGNDWVIANIEQRVQGLFLRNKKIPYEQSGANLVGSEVETVLLQGARQDIVAEDAVGKPIYTVIIPDVDAMTEAQRASRKLTGVKFTFRLAGAIQEAVIKGQVNY